VPQPVTPAPAATGTAPTPAAPATQPVQPAPGTTLSSTDTQPRNPFHGLGDTPEEILSRLQAKNIATSAAGGVNPPTPASPPAPTTLPQTRPLPPVAPSLPVSIGTPILPKTAPLVPVVEPGTSGSVAAPAPAVTATRAEIPNPLVAILSGIKPGALLVKHVDRDAPDLDKLRAEVEKTDEAALTKSAQSFTGVNLAAELHRLPSATLLLHGKDDPLLPPPDDDLIRRINQGKPEGHFLAFIEPGLRHFPMLEITAKFNRLLIDFLDAQDLTNVQFKDQWIRIFR
jgi:pimeloyl-ACP methyl ester carboxylesterase